MPTPKATYPLLAVAALAMAACAPLRPKVSAAPAPAPVAPAVAKKSALPNQELTAQTLYQFLVGEVALQRGQPRLATAALLDLAKSTRDPRLAQRATESAIRAKEADQAVSAAELWQSLEPDSVQASQTVAALLLGSGRLQEARPFLERIIAASPGGQGGGFLQLGQLLARQRDHQAALELVQELTKPYPDSVEAHFAVAQVAWSAGKTDLAMASLREVERQRPDWELAAIFHGQILQRTSAADALAFYSAFLSDHPKSKDVRLAYARLLVGEKQYREARAQFLRLMEDTPNDAEVSLAIGLLASQENDLDAAESYLKQALDSGYKDPDMVRFYLGQVDEERKHWDDAVAWYDKVEEGEYYFNARVHAAGALAKAGRLEDGRHRLQSIQPQNNQQRVLLIQAEAQLLRDAKHYREAFDLLGKGLEKLPNQPDLLYDHAMAAEKLGKVDLMEKDLRRLIQLKPDNANAYNALGYTLAERGIRLDEARELVEKALSLAPDDAFIIDSMGWVYFRLGQSDKALEALKHALELRKDPEIAAHLGEVLWSRGEQAEARKVWESALKLAPDNEVLRDVMQKFK